MESCGQQLGLSGIAHVRVSIRSTGTLGSVGIDGGDASFQECIARESANVEFPDTQRGVVEIPIQL